eukprot:g8897.t1
MAMARNKSPMTAVMLFLCPMVAGHLRGAEVSVSQLDFGFDGAAVLSDKGPDVGADATSSALAVSLSAGQTTAATSTTTESTKRSCTRHWGKFMLPEHPGEKAERDNYETEPSGWEMEVYSTWTGGDATKTRGVLLGPDSEKNTQSFWAKPSNRLNRVLIALPEYRPRNIVQATKEDVCERFANDEKFLGVLKAEYFDVVVPLFRPPKEQHPRGDKLVWGGGKSFGDAHFFGQASNAAALKGGYSDPPGSYATAVKGGRERDAFTSFEVMDQIVARVAERTKRQVIVAGHSGGCQFVQRWAFVSQIPKKILSQGPRVDVVYGLLDFTRPSVGWMMQNCSGRKGTKKHPPQCRSPQAMLERDRIFKKPTKVVRWTTFTPNSLLPKWDMDDLVRGRTKTYMPTLRDERTHSAKGLPRKSQRMHLLRTFPEHMRHLLGDDEKEPFLTHTNAGYQRKHHDEWVASHLLSEVFGRFRLTLVLNQGDRCNCAGGQARKVLRKNKLRIKRVFKVNIWCIFRTSNVWDEYFVDPAPDGPCQKLNKKQKKGHFELKGHFVCKGNASGFTVDNSQYALSQGFTRYQRGRTFQFWLQDRNHAGFTVSRCQKCMHTWTNARRHIAGLLGEKLPDTSGTSGSESGSESTTETITETPAPCCGL